MANTIRDDRVQLMLNVSFVANSWPSQGRLAV
jgi:hypothetical protein